MSKIGALIETIRSRYGYNWRDFVRIIHIADTDGAFAQNCIKETEVENIRYYEDHIEYFDIEEVKKRNMHKSEIMFKLYTTGKIRNIQYRLYFNSCNTFKRHIESGPPETPTTILSSSLIKLNFSIVFFTLSSI